MITKEITMHDTNIPTVYLTDLVPDRCNFKDRTFEAFVRQFMREFMPGINRMLLEDKIADHDEDDLGWRIRTMSPEDLNLAAVAAEDAGVDEDLFVILHDNERIDPSEVFSVIQDWNIPEPDGLLEDDTPFWHDEDDAESVVYIICEAESGPTLGAYPWAWNYSWMPDDRIRDDELRQAGFIVADYASENAKERFAGIDGAGYSFEGDHFARLCAIVHENRARYGWTVETDNGPAYITTEPRGEE